MQIVLLSHGYFAKELMRSCKYINSDIDDVDYLCLTDEGIDKFGESIKCLLQENREEEKLFFCDLAHGSPYNQLLIALLELGITNYRIISGMNLPMLLQATIMVQLESNLAHISEECSKIGSSGIVVYEPNND